MLVNGLVSRNGHGSGKNGAVASDARSAQPAPHAAGKPAGDKVERLPGRSGSVIYRARTLAEILPLVRAELGPDAIIVRQREGLTGGFAGFFQRRCVEVEARPAHASFDAYDEAEPVLPPPREPIDATGVDAADASVDGTSESTPRVRDFRELLARAANRARQDREATAADIGAPSAAAGLDAPADGEGVSATAAEPAADAASSVEEGRDAAPFAASTARPLRSLRANLEASGLSGEFAGDLVQEVSDHLLPFASSRALRRLARQALARRLPPAPLLQSARPLFAVLGPPGSGRTAVTLALARSYARERPAVAFLADRGQAVALLAERAAGREVTDAGSEAAALRPLAALEEELPKWRGEAVVAVELPALAGGTDGAERALADVDRLQPDLLLLALPATLARRSAERLLAPFVGRQQVAAAITQLDLEPAPAALLEALIRVRLPVAFVAAPGLGNCGVAPADPSDLAARLVR